MKNSTIEWTHHTFNPWIGCTQVSPACDHCYAMVMMDHRYHRVEWGAGKPRIRTTPGYWRQPLKWNRLAEAAGVRERVFCASLADVFDGEMPETLSAWRADLWQLIDQTPRLDWLLLTKRPGNIMRFAPWKGRWPHNVWVGTSVENEEWAGRRLSVLAEVPAVVRFVSAEPLLGDFSLANYAVDWVIVGGESGHGFRELNVDHARSLRDQCRERGIPFFFKQWGGRSPKARGRELDGQLWSQIPTPRANLEACEARTLDIEWDERRKSAYHEAGHVVVRGSYGARTAAVMIYEDGTGLTVSADVLWDVSAQVDATVAGSVAESMFLGKAAIPAPEDIQDAVNGNDLDEVDDEWLTDLDHAVQILRNRAPHLKPKERVAAITSAHIRCQDVLHDRWSQVERLADALQSSPTGVLEYAHIEALLVE